MPQDRYGNQLSTNEEAAKAYSQGLDLFLGAEAGVDAAYAEALNIDPEFAQAHVGLARQKALYGKWAEARQAIATAESLLDKVNAQEASHIKATSFLLHGRSAEAYQAIQAHLSQYPRDALMAQTCTGVFSLIGFSGQRGREAEHLAFTTKLLPHYEDDWWFQGQHAFALGEVGKIDSAMDHVQHSLSGNPRNGNAAHILTHINYEAGEHGAGYYWLKEWLTECPQGASLFGHLTWHRALWALELGEMADTWPVIKEFVAPSVSKAPPVNVVTDFIAFLFRAYLKGETVSQDLWQQASEYAATTFPNPGNGFVDIHAVIAHAMAGQGERLKHVREMAKGPIGDMIPEIAAAYEDFAQKQWAEVVSRLGTLLSQIERIGGSRAQSDMLLFTVLAALMHQGKHETARLMLASRRANWQGLEVLPGF